MRIIFILLMAIMLYACSPVYLPNARNVPMFSKAGEVQGSLSFMSGYNYQAAVAVTNHIGIMGNGMYADSKSDIRGSINRYSFNEFGVGYYSNNDKYYFDLFGGFGVGKTTGTDSVFAIHAPQPSGYDINLSSATYNRFFVQPSFGLKRKHFHGALAYRFSLMDFKNGVRNGRTIELNRTPVMFFEPAFIAKFPFEKFVIGVQVGLSTPMNKADLYFDYIPMVVSTSIGFRLNYEVKK
ncbi:MAG TPA: hypothetical protein DGG95_02220 [Cytophagales bacterium]|jgi:hypothetical protein|nr:hypothetical protein [Cytophagales bacterium]